MGVGVEEAGPPGVVPLPGGGGGGAKEENKVTQMVEYLKVLVRKLHTFTTWRWRWSTHIQSLSKQEKFKKQKNILTYVVG